MGLKQLLREKAILQQQKAINFELTLQEEPLIYSIKQQLALRRMPRQYFRNKRFSSMVKCHFRSYYNTGTPVVLLVKFFVSPPEKARVSKRQLKAEKTPATFSHEVCEYLLSLLEMLNHNLFNSYRQVVKIDVEKYYSDRPRTVMKFMKWSHYVELYQNNNPAYSASEGIMEGGKKRRSVQSKRKGDGVAAEDGGAIDHGISETDVQGSVTGDSSLSHAEPPEDTPKDSQAISPETTYKETRRRQSRKVSQ